MYKKNILMTSILTLSLIFLFGLTNFFIDPFQQYRIASFYKPYFMLQRYMMPGLSKNLNYNTAIVGGICLLDNFNISEVDSILNVKSAKLNMQGGSPYGTSIMLKTIFRENKNIKNIIYGLPISAYMKPHDFLQLGEKFPKFLYDDNLFNDYKYLLSIDTFLSSIKGFLKNLFNMGVYSLDINTAYHWVDSPKNYGSKNVEKMWKEKISETENRENLTPINLQKQIYFNMIENLNKNIIPHIDLNKNVNFTIYFIPYSIAYLKDISNRGLLDEFLSFREYCVKELNKRKNITMLDFQLDINLIYNFKYYKDFVHYSKEVNSIQVEYIKDKKFLVNDSNIQEHNNIIEQIVRRFKFKGN